MIIEIDTSLADKLGDITMNQLVFLSCVLNEIKTQNQNVQLLLSRVSEPEIRMLIDNDWVSESKTTDALTEYKATDRLKQLAGADTDYFDALYALYPVYVYRPDGTKSFLRTNIKRCRSQYKKIVGKSKATHEHIMQCLNFEVIERTKSGSTGYMKTLWNWLTSQEWEAVEEAMNHTIDPLTATPKKVKLDGFF